MGVQGKTHPSPPHYPCRCQKKMAAHGDDFAQCWVCALVIDFQYLVRRQKQGDAMPSNDKRKGLIRVWCHNGSTHRIWDLLKRTACCWFIFCTMSLLVQTVAQREQRHDIFFFNLERNFAPSSTPNHRKYIEKAMNQTCAVTRLSYLLRCHNIRNSLRDKYIEVQSTTCGIGRLHLIPCATNGVLYFYDTMRKIKHER